MSQANKQVSRGEALALLAENIDAHKFSSSTAEADVKYATNVLQWLLAGFVLYEADPRISSDFYDGYPSAHLPASIRSLFLSEIFPDGKRYERPAGSTVRIVPDQELIPARIPMLEMLLAQGLNFTQVVDYFSTHPDELKGSSTAKCYLLTKYAVSLYPHSSRPNGWGISLVSDARDIRVFPFGKDGETEPAVNWMLTYYERPHILAEVATYAGLLAVKHASHVKPSIEAHYLEEIAALANAEPLGSLYCMDVDDGSTAGLILKTLMNRGVISEKDLKN